MSEYIRCEKCDSEWKSKHVVNRCPFCGADIEVESHDDGGLKPPFDNSGDALKYIMKKHGADAMLGSSLTELLNKYVPNMGKLRKNVFISAISSGAAEIIRDVFKKNANADESVKENTFRTAIQKIVDEHGTDRSIVESVVREITNAIGWHISAHAADLKPQQTVKVPGLNTGVRGVRFGQHDWRVLDAQDGKTLLLSEDIIGRQKYNNSLKGEVMWETCSLRQYLNGEYLRTFSKEERSRIVNTLNRNVRNPWYVSAKGGGDTTDKIFLLSLDEVVKYFGDSGQLEKRPGNSWYIDDKYNRRRVAKYNGEELWWWLRSPGFGGYRATYVGHNGNIDMYGNDVNNVNYDLGGIRPALWIYDDPRGHRVGT